MLILIVCGLVSIPFLKGLAIYGKVTGDPRLQAAKVAQKQLPQFFDELSQAKPGQRFAIKAKFATDMGPEYLWLKNPTRKDQTVEGTLDQDPISLKAKKGDLLQVKMEAVVDWLIRDPDGTLRGGYTNR